MIEGLEVTEADRIEEIQEGLRLNIGHPDAVAQAVWELSELADDVNAFGRLLGECAADLRAALPEVAPVS